MPVIRAPAPPAPETPSAAGPKVPATITAPLLPSLVGPERAVRLVTADGPETVRFGTFGPLG